MPDAATASRRRPVFDVRLLIGVALVIGSVAGVLAIVSASDRRTTVYVAVSSLSPGDRIDAGDLAARRVSRTRPRISTSLPRTSRTTGW